MAGFRLDVDEIQGARDRATVRAVPAEAERLARRAAAFGHLEDEELAALFLSPAVGTEELIAIARRRR